jgi:transposase-like protein
MSKLFRKKVSKKPITRYPAEFKERAVKLHTELKYSPAQIAEQLGCSSETVRKWINKHLDALPTDEYQKIVLVDKENKTLHKENERLKRENDFLKKAAAYFAQESL